MVSLIFTTRLLIFTMTSLIFNITSLIFIITSLIYILPPFHIRGQWGEIWVSEEISGVSERIFVVARCRITHCDVYPSSMTSQIIIHDVTNYYVWRHELLFMTSRTIIYSHELLFMTSRTIIHDVTNYYSWRHELLFMTSRTIIHDVTNYYSWRH